MFVSRNESKPRLRYCTSTISRSIIKLQTLMTCLRLLLTNQEKHVCITAKLCYAKKTQPRYNQIGPNQF